MDTYREDFIRILGLDKPWAMDIYEDVVLTRKLKKPPPPLLKSFSNPALLQNVPGKAKKHDFKL